MVISNSCKIVLKNLILSLKIAAENLALRNISTGLVQPVHILQSLKMLCSGTPEINDVDFERLESHLKDTKIIRDEGNIPLILINYIFHSF